MNKEFNESYYQNSPHNEGQQNNIAQQRTDGINNPPEVERTEQNEKGGGQQNSNNKSGTESDRANKNEDQGIRSGNSSI